MSQSSQPVTTASATWSKRQAIQSNSHIKERKNEDLSSPTPMMPSPPSKAFLPSPLAMDEFTPPPSPGLSIEGSSTLPAHLLKSAVPSNKAYFSSQPPPMPLLLVPVSVPSSVAVIFACNKTIRKEPLEQNVILVRALLQEVITMLPLSRVVIPRSSMSSYKHSRLSSESSLIGKGSMKCHVATQAHTNENVVYEPNISSHVSVAGSADEWLGGVRALRDSHVRLVLRQLRHIDRLNRALDRVRYTPFGKTPCADDVTTKHNTCRS